jgi:5-methylcytosine-specific restriction endonuclease McrA
MQKTHCKHGHEIAVVGRDTRGNCRECHRLYSERYHRLKTGYQGPKRKKHDPKLTKRQKAAIYAKDYYATNKEKFSKYQKENPEKCRGISHRRRARKLKATIEIFDERAWFNEMRLNQLGQCFYCAKTLITLHIDHMIPLSRGGGHSKDNLCLACPSCNRTKSNKTVEEFLSLTDN